MRKPDVAFFIDNTVQRHAPQFEQVDLLAVYPCDTMIRVGQTDERDSLILPELLEGRRRIGAKRDNFRIPIDEFLILLTQARQLRAAIRSHEAAQKSQDHGLAAAELRKTDAITIYIFKLEIGRELPRGDQFILHIFLVPKNHQILKIT